MAKASFLFRATHPIRVPNEDFWFWFAMSCGALEISHIWAAAKIWDVGTFSSAAHLHLRMKPKHTPSVSTSSPCAWLSNRKRSSAWGPGGSCRAAPALSSQGIMTNLGCSTAHTSSITKVSLVVLADTTSLSAEDFCWKVTALCLYFLVLHINPGRNMCSNLL